MLALLLSDVRRTNGASNQSRNQSNQAKSYKQEKRTDNQQAISSAFAAAILEALRAEVREDVAKREQDHADHEDWSTPSFWLDFGLTALLVLVGTVYTIAALRQLHAIHVQSEIAKTTADAAMKNAEVARLALSGNRPYLLTIYSELDTTGEPLSAKDAQRLERTAKSIHIHHASIRFKNFGEGPAIINAVVGHLRLQRIEDDFPKPHDFNECITMTTEGADVITSQRSCEFSLKVDRELTDEEIRRMWTTPDFIFYGFVCYEDVFHTSYRTEFCYRLTPLGGVIKTRFTEKDLVGFVEFGSFWAVGPRANNYRT